LREKFSAHATVLEAKNLRAGLYEAASTKQKFWSRRFGAELEAHNLWTTIHENKLHDIRLHPSSNKPSREAAEQNSPGRKLWGKSETEQAPEGRHSGEVGVSPQATKHEAFHEQI
jgi:hypothetical protein